MAGDQLVVGIIIFVIIVVIQFVVITKGATRISEVAARFALDGMPGKQMAIDADLNAGIIDENEAQRRREEITQQADFYGAMDGASKFVRGDAIAGIIITIINIIGGFVIGVSQYGMTFADAAEVFTKLTIGDGLVSQVPAFLISLAAGLLVTRSTQQSEPAGASSCRSFSRPQALAVTAGFLGILIFTNLPTMPLLALGAGCGSLALMLTRQTKAKEQKQAEQAKADADRSQPEERIEDFLTIDPMEIEIGVGADPAGRARSTAAICLPRITARAAERRRRHRHHPAEGPHSRQHAAGRARVSHQDRQHPRGPRRSPSGQAAGDRLGRDDRQDRRHRDHATRPSSSRRSGSTRARPTRPRCSATRWSSRRPCWPRTCRKSSAATPTRCSPATPRSTWSTS